MAQCTNCADVCYESIGTACNEHCSGGCEKFVVPCQDIDIVVNVSDKDANIKVSIMNVTGQFEEASASFEGIGGDVNACIDPNDCYEVIVDNQSPGLNPSVGDYLITVAATGFSTNASMDANTSENTLIGNCGAQKKSDDVPMERGISAVKAYPNPFSNATTIAFHLRDDDFVTLEIFNLIGAKVATLYNGPVKGGTTYKRSFNPTNLAIGSYIYRLTSNNQGSYYDKLQFVK